MPFINHLRRRLADQVLPTAAGIRVVSLRIKESLQKRYGTRIVEPAVIPIAVPTALPEPVPLPPHPFQFTLITVGRLEPEKRIEDILYALARLDYRHQNVGLIVVGDGSERGRLERLTRHLGLTDRVLFTGWIEGKALGMLRSAQMYVQASAYEGYGRTLIEAALARLPIVTTDVGIVGEVLRGYEEVLAAPPGDPTNLAAHILGLLNDPQTRELLARAAEAAATKHLSAMGDVPTRIRDDLAKAIATARTRTP
jgi:glycosyltransferase involved in cell wall biosynthesis